MRVKSLTENGEFRPLPTIWNYEVSKEIQKNMLFILENFKYTVSQLD